eukprot:5681498-Prymnesium_polylepis.1
MLSPGWRPGDRWRHWLGGDTDDSTANKKQINKASGPGGKLSTVRQVRQVPSTLSRPIQHLDHAQRDGDDGALGGHQREVVEEGPLHEALRL